MKKYRDFKCSRSYEYFDRLVEDDVEHVFCNCGYEAKRQFSAPRVKGNTTGGSPSFSNKKW